MIHQFIRRSGRGLSFIVYAAAQVAVWGGGLAATTSLRAETNSPISKIEVSGNRRIEKDAILEKMKLRVGRSPEAAQVREDILAIFDMGYFEDVQFDFDAGILKVLVRERPVVTKIEYTGSEEFETKDLEEASGLKPFHVLNLAKIRTAQETIAKKYEEKGYYLARAEYDLIPVPNKATEVQLKFRIRENEKVKIRRIFFSGNKVFASGDLKQNIVSAEGHAFSWATSGGTYREAVFERDLALLASFYGNSGYIEAKFTKPRVTLSQDRRYVDINIDVEEGKQYFLGNVSFRGDLLFTEDDLRQSFDMAEKDVFSTGKLQEEVLKLTDKYGDEGYAFANVIPRPQIREGTQIVDLNFDVERGEKAYWGKITVTGNTKTHDKVIRRELRFHEGELYNATRRKKSVERVRSLGFFGNDVNFLTSSPKDASNVLDLEIRVVEKPTGSLNVSAGYGSSSGFLFQASVSQNNLFGLGQQLNFSLSLNQHDAKQFSLSFLDPKIFDSEWLGGFELYLSEEPLGSYSTRTYTQKTFGGKLKMGREILDNLTLYTTYKREYYHLQKPIARDIFTDHDKDERSYISSVALTLDYDTRNNRLDPSGGMYLSGSSEFAGLGGRVFQKFLASARFYRKVFWKLVYRSNYQVGYLINVMGADTVPDSERFTIGGIYPHPLRGYPDHSVGTTKDVVNLRDPEADKLGPQPYTIGGTKLFLINQELEFPMIPEADIRLALFFDAGNAFDHLTTLQPKASPVVLTSYGWGLRWYSPLGPLRFEWGYPLTVGGGKTGKGSEFHFIIAPTF